MPRGRQLESLLDLSLSNVVRHIDDYWCKDYKEIYGKENRFFRFVVGPFDALPSKLLCELIRLLKEEKRLRRHHLELLITVQLRSLDLSRETEDARHPLQLAAIRCPDLRTLNLKSCDKISKHVYQEYLPLFTKLQVLDLSLTKSGDSCLFVLGAYCRDLRELDISNCPVTDDGIRGLCCGVDDLGQPSERLGQCKLITKLNVNFTRTTERGIQMALENLVQLKVFECCSSVQVLSQMHRAAWEARLPDIPKYSLIDLHCTESFMPYSHGALDLAVSLCDSLIKVRLDTQDQLSDSDLMALLNIKRLQELNIGSGETCNISFSEGIFPLLQAHGQHLKSLTFRELPLVNVRAIAEFCPNLQNLSLLMNKAYDSYWPEEEQRPLSSKIVKEPAVLGRLDSFQFASQEKADPSKDIPAKHLLSILSSPFLTRMSIKDCSTLTDKLWQKVAALHQFSNLECLELEQCSSISEQSINLLMNRSNRLSLLRLLNCPHLTRKQATLWRQKAQKNRWQLSIDWL